MDPRTEDITDKQRIRELQNHYSYSIDSGKYDNLDAIFTPNATYHFVTGSTDNIEALKTNIRDALSPLKASQHINGNHWAEIEAGLAFAISELWLSITNKGCNGGNRICGDFRGRMKEPHVARMGRAVPSASTGRDACGEQLSIISQTLIPKRVEFVH